MNWKESLTNIENDFGFHKKRDWKSAVRLVDELLTENLNDVELNIRGIYIFHNILVEEDYPDEEQAGMEYLLQKWFNRSKEKFSDNAEYLFFIGKILHIAEWYFGLEDTTLAIAFQKKAMELEPENLLYKWAYRFSFPGDVDEGFLAYKLLTNDIMKIKWLQSKGFPGEYILEHLKMREKEYLAKEISQ
ncbi:hypothetical protein [Chitinophaga sp. Cy-1792]|uniref:hypothetical protein n=1 Tax=Chitinophaga sp. Cy-1792 TaxID=2608339 RepID=UPI0019653582|nr:hypothetical protein [Chitinophaga sp. Cy-1792]